MRNHSFYIPGVYGLIEEDRQINRQLCLSISAKKKSMKLLWEHIGEDFHYSPKRHREGFLEEVKAALRPKFIKELDEIVEKVKKGSRNTQAAMATLNSFLFFSFNDKVMRYFKVV